MLGIKKNLSQKIILKFVYRNRRNMCASKFDGIILFDLKPIFGVRNNEEAIHLVKRGCKAEDEI